MAKTPTTMTSDELLALMNSTFGPDWMKSLDGQSTVPFGFGLGGPTNAMANFYNVPYSTTAAAWGGSRGNPVTVYPGQQQPGGYGGGSLGGATMQPPKPQVPVTQAPVTVPPVQGTGGTPVNGGLTGGMTSGMYSPVNLMTPPPLGTNWRGTMKYGM